MLLVHTHSQQSLRDKLPPAMEIISSSSEEYKCVLLWFSAMMAGVGLSEGRQLHDVGFRAGRIVLVGGVAVDVACN